MFYFNFHFVSYCKYTDILSDCQIFFKKNAYMTECHAPRLPSPCRGKGRAPLKYFKESYFDSLKHPPEPPLPDIAKRGRAEHSRPSPYRTPSISTGLVGRAVVVLGILPFEVLTAVSVGLPPQFVVHYRDAEVPVVVMLP